MNVFRGLIEILKYFARPAWQDKAASTYLKTLGPTYKGLYNNTGRAFPDIAAQSSK